MFLIPPAIGVSFAIISCFTRNKKKEKEKLEELETIKKQQEQKRRKREEDLQRAKKA